MKSKVELLLEQVENNGCKISSVQNKESLEFIDGLKDLYRNKKKPQITRSAEILREVWGIEIARRRLSDHIRGECACPKT